jgi:transposase-like protein
MCDNIRIPRCRLTAQSVEPESANGKYKLIRTRYKLHTCRKLFSNL